MAARAHRSPRHAQSDHTPSASNATVWRWDFHGSAFGDHTPLTDPDGDSVHFTFNLRFPGQYFDTESGMHYNYFRNYEPGVGKYVESDPVGLTGGLHTYGYSLQNPVRFTDRSGLFVDTTGEFLLQCGRVGVSTALAPIVGVVMLVTPSTVSQCQDSNPPLGVECADGDERCRRAITEARNIYNDLRHKRIPQYMYGTRHGSADSGHYDAINEKIEALKDAIRRVRRWCQNLPEDVQDWEKMVNGEFPSRH